MPSLLGALGLQTHATRAEPLEKERANEMATPPRNSAITALLRRSPVVNGAKRRYYGAITALYGGPARGSGLEPG